MSLGLAVAAACCADVGVAAVSPGAGSEPVTVTSIATTGRTAAPKATFPAGVRIAGVRLAGLDSAGAEKAVRRAFARPLPLMIDGTEVDVDPTKLATAYVSTAISRARAAAPGENVRLVVSVHGTAVRALVAKLAKRLDRKGVSARLTLRAGQPHVSQDRTGRRLVQGPVVADVVHALGANTRLPLDVTTQAIKPGLTQSEIGSVILINRSLNRLTYFDGGTVHRFPVATGQTIYPTPSGRFQIVVKQMNPWWYPPVYDDWAKGLSPVPPGPSNPLGTRWMGLSAPGVGIHGTNNASSIGYSVSHGCIRMQVPDAEWLFDHVGVGTTVFIV